MNSKVNSVQAPLEMRVASRLSYEKFTLLTRGKVNHEKHLVIFFSGKTIRPQGCYETIDNGKKFVECVVNTFDGESKISGQTIYRWAKLSNNLFDDSNVNDAECVF